MQCRADWLSGPLLKVKVEKFAEEFYYSGFIYLNEWLDRFKNIYGITFGKICDEVKFTNTADICRNEKWPVIRERYIKNDKVSVLQYVWH